MSEKPTMNSISFGIIYFFMFAIAFSIDVETKMIAYPMTGESFWGTMFLDSVIGISIGLVVVVISQMISARSNAMKDLGKDFYKVIQNLKKEEIFFLAFFSSVGEEYLFRGIIQGYAGVVIASILFGILHIAPGEKGRVWSLFAMIMGLIMGLAYEWRQNIFVPIWIHFVVNYFNVLLLQRKMKNIDASST